MNFFSDENRNNYNFNKNLKYFQDQNTPKKQYRCTCPKCFSCTSCNLACCSSCCNCSLCSRIRTFRKSRPYLFALILTVIILIVIILLIVIIAVSVKKSKNEEENKDFMEIYNKIGNNDKGSLDQFCKYLSSEASGLNEKNKVNLAYKWITENIRYDDAGVTAGTEERDPDKFFESRKTVCSGYARLLRRLLESMGYNPDNIKNIAGYAKGSGYSVYKEPKEDHEWNAVKIDGKWCLFDVTWDEGETDYDYFCPNPNCFVRTHLPSKSEDQFLEKPIDLNTFHGLTLTTGLFCKLDAKIVEDKSYYNQCSGKFKITIGNDNDNDRELDIITYDSVDLNKRVIDKGYEVDFAAKDSGQFELNMGMFDENGNGLGIGTIFINCNKEA